MISGLVLVVFFWVSFAIMSGAEADMATQEVFGYLSIIVSLVFVFFGIRSYRNEALNGKISFWRALGTGMLITLFPAFLFGIFDTVYTTFINPDFYSEYYDEMIQQYEATYSGEELQQKVEEMESMQAMISDYPYFGFILMFLTVAIIGFIISLISAMVLRRREVTEG